MVQLRKLCLTQLEEAKKVDKCLENRSFKMNFSKLKSKEDYLENEYLIELRVLRIICYQFLLTN